MSERLSAQDRAKHAAAVRAAKFVNNGMKVGLGTGSTAAFLVAELGRRQRDEGIRITGVPTSTRTAEQAQAEGIELTTLDEAGWLDVTIDGADEFDAAFNLIKGGGGALLREKIVAAASDQMIVIADRGKSVETLGTFPLPVEVLEFGLSATRRLLADTLYSLDVPGREVTLRTEGDAPFVTDEGNRILDLHLRRIVNPRQVALVLNQLPGIVENGLFVDICDTVIVGYEDGRAEVRSMPAEASPVAGNTAAPQNLFAGSDD